MIKWCVELQIQRDAKMMRWTADFRGHGKVMRGNADFRGDGKVMRCEKGYHGLTSGIGTETNQLDMDGFDG
jgi:hypothetical protein